MTIALRARHSANGIYPELICSKFNLKLIHLELGPAYITSDNYLWKFWLVVAGILSNANKVYVHFDLCYWKIFFDDYFFLSKEKKLHPIPKSS